MANIYNTVVVRKDLNMSAGLMAAQVAHINDMFMRTKIYDEKDFTTVEKDWIKSPYLHVLGVDNPEELKEVLRMAKEQNLPTYEWYDLIPSKNLNRPISNVLIGIAIGPCDLDKVKAVTGSLPLA